MRVKLEKWLLLVMGFGLLLLSACQRGDVATPADLEVPEDAVARIVYFEADDCEYCTDIYEDVIDPLQARCGTSLEVKTVDVGTTEGYEALVATETVLVGEPGRWDLPVVVVDDIAYVGENAIRESLLPYLKCVFGSGGNDWPAVPALNAIAAEAPVADSENPFGSISGDGLESCVDDEESDVCASPMPIFALYFTSSDCTDTCERTRYDLTYLKGVYPQLSFETRLIDENRELAAKLGERLGVPQELWDVAPAVVFGEDYLVGDDLDLETLKEHLAQYAESGATALWYALE